MICKNCNSEIPNDSEYCSFCGNVVQSVIPAGISSDLSKGYTYLELKQWKDAEQFFRDAIINGENTAEAYIGKMLAKYKTDSIEKLVASGKKFSSDDDFKLALKYADGEYADCLKECVLKSANKTKKRTIIVSSICACAIVIALLSYFVLIPLGRNIYYKDLLADGKVQKAAKSYTSSKWFEYNKMAKDLFYENGLKLVEAKDYKNAEICFDVADNHTDEINDLFYKSGLELIKIKDYKNAEICFEIIKNYSDSKNYYNYSKAQNLLANNDLESYNYFTDLGDFLDSKEILNTNKYFVMVNKLQGEWYSPAKTQAQQKRELRESGKYYEANGRFYKKEYFESYQQFLEAVAEANGGTIDNVPRTITIIYDSSTIRIDGGIGLRINQDGNITHDDNIIEVIDDTHIKIGKREYKKQ